MQLGAFGDSFVELAFRVGVGRISPDSARIDAAVEKIIDNGGRLDDVQAILVGHAV